MDRRKFISATVLPMTLINITGSAAPGILAKKVNTLPDSENKIGSRPLGKTGISLPILSMGVMNASNPNLLKAAWEKGIRHFDTAWFYQNGNNERMVGSVLRGLNVSRKDVTIATKVGLFGPPISNGKERKELFVDRFDESLSRLNMDYVDILYYHAAQGPEQTNDPFIMEAFTELKAKKKIRFAGFSIHNDWPAAVTEAADRKFYDVLLVSFNYSMFNDQRVFNALEMAHKAGIGLVAMKTQCRQDWYKRDLPAEQQKYYDERNLNPVLLKWALRHEYITTAVPGFTTYEQLDEDITAASDLTYTKAEEDFLKSRDVKLSIQSVCRHCGVCVGTCPQRVDIPSLMRTHMYSFSYGNPLLARQTLSQIQPAKGLETCQKCRECMSRCQYKVSIADKIQELKEIYC